MRTKPDQLRMRLSRLLPDMPATSRSGGGDPAIEARLAEARSAFVEGYRKALSTKSDALARLFENEPAQRMGFALEGAGMAAVLMDAFGNGGHLEALLAGRSAAEQTLVAIGVGWAGARLRRPVDRLPLGIDRRHGHAAADGYGFHQGFFHAERFAERGFPAGRGDLGASYDVGLGRALWFVHGGRVDPLSSAVDGMPLDRRARLWKGVGTACAFTGCAERAAKRTCKSAAPYETHFRTGIETGLELLRALAQPKKEIPL